MPASSQPVRRNQGAEPLPATRLAAGWTSRAVLAAILLAAFGLRVYRLGWQELRGDEAFGYFFSQATWAQIIDSTLALREPHPVASYFLQNAWLAAAGHS